MTWTLLHEACEHLDAKTIYDRCKLGTNEPLEVDDHGSTPLHILAWGNPDPKLLQALVSSCPVAVTDTDIHGDTCLHVACSYPGTTVKVVKVLLDTCPTLASMPNKEGLMPLHVACRFAPENEAVIGYLIDAYPCALRSHIKMGFRVPTKERDSLRTLNEEDHFVSRVLGTKNLQETRFQSLTAQIRDGAYPLHMAVAAGAPKSVLEMMIKEADDVLILTNKFGQTPLHVAVATRAEDEVIELLIDNGVKALRAKDKEGNLPIHLAASHGCSVRVAKALLRHYLASIHEKNASGLTPLDVAMGSMKCDEAVLRLFEITDDSEVPEE